jgi:hypothetical protein
MAEDVREGAAVASIVQLRYIASCPLTSPILKCFGSLSHPNTLHHSGQHAKILEVLR